MAWIESHQALEKHPKILSLSCLMGWSLDETLGKVHRFWWWCLDYAPTGDLRDVDWSGFGVGLGMTGDDCLKFREALMTTHLICRMTRTRLPWRIHDWIEHAGRYLRDTRFRRDPEKYAQVVELYKIKCQPTVSRHGGRKPKRGPAMSAVPDLTDLTGPNQPDLTNQPEEKSCAMSEPDTRHAGKSIKTWEAYAGAYQQRYGAVPLRNAKVNSLLCQFVDRVGRDKAPILAAFYLTHNNPFYVKLRHPVHVLLQNAEALHTEWITGVKATTNEVKNAEQRDNAVEQMKRVRAQLEGGRNGSS